MKIDVSMTAEEMTALEEILKREVDQMRVELRRTWNAQYKEQIERHLHLIENALEAIEASLHAAHVPSC